MASEKPISATGTTQTRIAVRDVKLDCVVHRNAAQSDDASSSSRLAVVVLHPYPWLGGSMRDHVTQSLWDAFANDPFRKYNTVVMYNSRGVGRSSGRATMFGAQKEVADLKALCNLLVGGELLENRPPQKVLLVGYSYGSQVCSGASWEPCVAGMAAISPPVGTMASTMLGTKSLWKSFLAAKIPKFAALGTADTFCSPKSLQQKLTLSETQVEAKIYEGSDHFWFKGLEKMTEDVLQWADQAITVA